MAPRKRSSDSAKTEETRKKRRISPGKNSDGGCFYTSQAERKRRAPTISMASLRDLENEETHEDYFIGTFGENSDTHATWGETIIKPILAVRKRGKGARFSRNDSLDPVASLFSQDNPSKIPNSPERSILLRFPLEVMEKIYGYLLRSQLPIMIDYQWNVVQAHGRLDIGIMKVCKQLGEEACRFIVEKNTFVAKLRAIPAALRGDTFSIEPKYLCFLRNVVLDCPRDSFNLYWHDNAAQSIDILTSLNTNINTLTIYVQPHRGIGLSTTSIGMEKCPLHFADFFHSNGNLMIAIRRLKPQFFNVILRKDLDMPGPFDALQPKKHFKRLLISLDLKHLRVGELKAGSLLNEETIKNARKMTAIVEGQLEGLKTRFEEIFADYESAIMEGKCRELSKEEKIHGGMALRDRC